MLPRGEGWKEERKEGRKKEEKKKDTKIERKKGGTNIEEGKTEGRKKRTPLCRRTLPDFRDWPSEIERERGREWPLAPQSPSPSRTVRRPPGNSSEPQ